MTQVETHYRQQPPAMSANDCVLHFEPDRVWVTDVVHEWNGESWQTLKSTCPKLRLDATGLLARAAAAGLSARVDAVRAGRRVLTLSRE